MFSVDGWIVVDGKAV